MVSFEMYLNLEVIYFVMQGEKLLGSLGGIFSRTWKPKKGRAITGPMITRGNRFITLVVNTIVKD